MAQQYRFSIGMPPLRIIAEHLVGDDGFKADARRILEIPTPEFEAFAHALIGFASFIDRERIDELAEQHLETADAQEVARIVHRLSSVIRDAQEEWENAGEILIQAIQNADLELEPEERSVFADRIRQFCISPIGLILQDKANRLASATGKGVEQSQVICDMRPVFDEERDAIVGAIPVCSLRMDYDDNGTPGSIEFRLGDESLKQLHREVTKGVKKMQVIRDVLSTKEISVPNTN